MVKAVLIRPPWFKKEGNIWKRVAGYIPPFNLLYLAAYLEKEGVEVAIIDGEVEDLNYQMVAQKVKLYHPDYVGITVTTVVVEGAYQIADLIKKELPGCKIIMGGVHATVLPEEVLSHNSIDFVIRGEGEITLAELVNGHPKEEVLGLSYSENDKFHHNPARPLIKDLDILPMPAYHLIPIKKYYPSLGNYRKWPALSVMVTRGCPGQCTFCCRVIFGNKVRSPSPGRIVEMIKLLQQNYGIVDFSFYDDVFLVSPKEVKEFCALVKKEDLNIFWNCNIRAEFFNEELLKIMKESGCYMIDLGIESGNEEILKNVSKNVTHAQIREKIAQCKKLKIDIRAGFMFGNPGETEETLEQTVQFALELEPDIVMFNITTPYPGTVLFNWAKENGYLKTFDWNRYDLSQCVMELPTVSSQTIERYYKTAYQRFYIRPSYLLKRFSKIRSFRDLIVAAKALNAVVLRQ